MCVFLSARQFVSVCAPVWLLPSFRLPVCVVKFYTCLNNPPGYSLRVCFQKPTARGLNLLRIYFSFVVSLFSSFLSLSLISSNSFAKLPDRSDETRRRRKAEGCLISIQSCNNTIGSHLRTDCFDRCVQVEPSTHQ